MLSVAEPKASAFMTFKHFSPSPSPRPSPVCKGKLKNTNFKVLKDILIKSYSCREDLPTINS